MKGIAIKIEQERVRRGLSYHDIARELGITWEWARDLEMHDNEIEMTLTEAQVLALCRILGFERSQLPAADLDS